jgi:hypothetical protein
MRPALRKSLTCNRFGLPSLLIPPSHDAANLKGRTVVQKVQIVVRTVLSLHEQYKVVQHLNTSLVQATTEQVEDQQRCVLIAGTLGRR